MSYLDRVVRVKWRDAFSDDSEVRAKDWEDDCIRENYGLCVRENESLISVAGSVITTFDTYSAVYHIPRSLIVEVTVLEGETNGN